jgi:outer membrane protein assembly factor BamB
LTPRPLAFFLVAAGCATGVDLHEQKFVAPSDVLQVRWRQHLTEEPLIEYKPQEFAAADSDGRRVYVGSSAGSFWGFDARDGRILWRRSVEGAVASRPLVLPIEGIVLVGTQGGALYALALDDGSERWVYHVKGPIESHPCYADGIVYFTTGENRVYALDAQKGTWKWQYDREPPEGFTVRGYGAPLVLGGKVYSGFSDGYLACLSAATGEVVWARSLGGEAARFVDVDATPMYYGGNLYVASYTGGVFALDPKDGSVRWRYDVEGAGSVRGGDGRVYFSAAKSGLHCLDIGGHLLWRQSLSEGGELSAPLVVGGYVLVSSAQGGTYVADGASGKLYQYFGPGHGVTAEPVSDGRQVYLLSNGGYFYALRIRR